jgi:hypothetical protein
MPGSIVNVNKSLGDGNFSKSTLFLLNDKLYLRSVPDEEGKQPFSFVDKDSLKITNLTED